VSLDYILAAAQRVYTHLDLAELASHTQVLSLLLIRSQEVTPEAVDGDHTNPEQPLTLGAECLVLEERREEAKQGYHALQKLPKNDVRWRSCVAIHLRSPRCAVRISSFGVLRVCSRSI
jgi:hypothetical protein